ncbi:MAG: 4-(cytidine 5'-diphospho)-2-C-methyl-D-erythritol kinase [Actinobacteria bacterium]|nr:4-(cytidine 5'-diphospho)-2-C-methyl-D-erythritol kinase [Actinomycetota bacterium]
MRVEAYAKINLSLRVEPPSPSGMHPIRTIAQTVDWADRVELEETEEDSFAVEGADLPTDGSNLVLKALAAVREATGRSHPVSIRLAKRIPVAAGLGGGSSDAAAVLALAAQCLRLDPRARDSLGPGIGADVALFLTGGLVRATGYGERVTRVPEAVTFHPAVAVPPFTLSTADVYRRWDEMDGPAATSTIATRHLPPALRSYGALVNDLMPAALDLAPDLGDWMSDLSRAWGTPVAMSGSGPSVFGLFPTRSEAEAAAADAPGARVARGCSQTGAGRARLG